MLIGRKCFIPSTLSFFRIRTTHVMLISFRKRQESKKFHTKLVISIPITFHILFIKLKLKLLYLGDFEESQFHIAHLISSIVDLFSTHLASSLLILGSTPLGKEISEICFCKYKALKNLLTLFFIALSPLIVLPLTFSKLILFFLFLPIARAWKYLVFLSLNLIEFFHEI